MSSRLFFELRLEICRVCLIPPGVSGQWEVVRNYDHSEGWTLFSFLVVLKVPKADPNCHLNGCHFI